MRLFFIFCILVSIAPVAWAAETIPTLDGYTTATYDGANVKGQCASEFGAGSRLATTYDIHKIILAGGIENITMPSSAWIHSYCPVKGQFIFGTRIQCVFSLFQLDKVDSTSAGRANCRGWSTTTGFGMAFRSDGSLGNDSCGTGRNVTCVTD